MKKILIAGIAAAAFCGAPAYAADMPMKAAPPAPMFNWTGFYVGGNGGYAWGTGSQQMINHSAIGGIDFFHAANPSGGFGGGQIGYNWQGLGSRFVLGIEADFEGADIKGSHSGVGTAAGPETHSLKVNSFGTVRGRIGYAFDRTLVYATGGLAYGHVDSQLSSVIVASVVERRTGTQTGFSVGGGLEYMLISNWSLKAEYQYIDLGSKPLGGAPGFAGFFSNPLDTAFHTVRIGLNYKFGS
jgi:outer membrane immunogenic protein